MFYGHLRSFFCRNRYLALQMLTWLLVRSPVSPAGGRLFLDGQTHQGLCQLLLLVLSCCCPCSKPGTPSPIPFPPLLTLLEFMSVPSRLGSLLAWSLCLPHSLSRPKKLWNWYNFWKQLNMWMSLTFPYTWPVILLSLYRILGNRSFSLIIYICGVYMLIINMYTYVYIIQGDFPSM